jgi:poly(A) polymerase/tRNA nucleotidyltransferase (CCA-adding enzyme)
MTIPKEVKKVLTELKTAGFEAYIVGGCVRDVLLGKEPKDWDVTTNAKPEEIQKVFSDSFYENKFLTVTVRTSSETIPEIEITTYRTEAGYSDKRHPDEVQYAKTLDEDLSRRDFTVNAMAMDEDEKVIDLFDGKKDLKAKIIRTVGNPNERFNEDALRMLRAARFATTLSFEIEPETAAAIVKNNVWLEAVSKERVRDELVKIIMADKAADGIELLRKLELLKFILPELQENYGVGQNKHHIYDCYEHAVKALEFTAKKKLGLDVRLAALFHDIGKPKTKSGDGKDSTFYNHEVVGAKMTFQILNRLKFPKKQVEKIVTLVRYHLFYYNVEEVGEASVRRLVKNVGPENMEELLQLRQADRIGSGVPKAEPYKLRHLKYIIEKVSKDPISAKMLKVNGKNVMDLLGEKPGPKVGFLLNILLGYVLDNPENNTKEFLEAKVSELGKLSEKELQTLSEKADSKVETVETKEDEMTKQKYWVS